MTRTISATDARVRFGRLLRDVAERGETVVVEKSGTAKAVVVPVGEYERLLRLETSEDRWEALLDELVETVDRDLGDRPVPRPEEMIRAMREKRDEELLDLR